MVLLFQADATLNEVIRAVVIRALNSCRTKSKAAVMLGINRHALQRRIRRHHIVEKDGVWQ